MNSALFRVSLYVVLGAQAFFGFIAWGEWNVPTWMHIGGSIPLLGYVGCTVVQVVGLALVGLEAFALVMRDKAKAKGHTNKAAWLVAGFAMVFVVNGLADWTGWYSVFGGDHSSRSTAVELYDLRKQKLETAASDATIAINRILGPDSAPRADAPRAIEVIEAELSAQNVRDQRWIEQEGPTLPKTYVDRRARLDAEKQNAIALAKARADRDSANSSLLTIGPRPESQSAPTGAINGLLAPFGKSIGDQELNAFYSLVLMVVMKYWIGAGFWASTFDDSAPKNEKRRNRIDAAKGWIASRLRWKSRHDAITQTSIAQPAPAPIEPRHVRLVSTTQQPRPRVRAAAGRNPRPAMDFEP